MRDLASDAVGQFFADHVHRDDHDHDGDGRHDGGQEVPADAGRPGPR